MRTFLVCFQRKVSAVDSLARIPIRRLSHSRWYKISGRSFCRKGVPHYVGTIAKIPDSLSAEFVEIFYIALAEGARIEQALWQARYFFMRKPGPPIWAYYVHYGIANSKLPGTENVIPHPRGVVADGTDRLLAKYRSKALVGREETMTTMDGFLSKNDSGTLLVTAEAGFGKTALLANWVMARQGKACSIAYHFFSNEDHDLRSIRSAYRHLLQQLLIFHDLADKPLPSDTEGLREALCHQLYSHRTYSNKPLVVVADAIDEADGELPPLPAPLGIFVIASARAEEQEKPAYLHRWADASVRVHLSGLSQTVIAAWLLLANKGKLAALAQDDALLRDIERKTEGFPLYLDFLIQEMLEAADRQQDPRQIVQSSPQGFTSYVRQQWQHLARMGSVKPEVQLLFALLAIALGPLSENDVHALTGLTSWDLHSLPWHVARWLTIRAEPSSFQCSMAHALLAEEFAKFLGPLAEQAQGKLLEYCASWEDHRSPYALTHYAEHLRDANRYEELFGLARHVAFQQVQADVCPGDPGLQLRTVQTALLAAGERDDPVAMAEFLLMHVGRVMASRQESPMHTLQVGDVNRAIATAELYGPEQRVLWYLLILWELKASGRSEQARTLLERLRQGAIARLSGWNSRWAAIVLGCLHEVDNQVRISDLALLMEDYGRCDLSVYLANRGHIYTAICIADAIESGRKGKALAAIAVAQAGAGQLEEAQMSFSAALSCTLGVQHAWRRAEALYEIAKVFALAGRLAWATDCVQGIEYDFYRAKALAALAVAQAEAGRVKAAQETIATALDCVERIRDDLHRIPALAQVASAQAQAGCLEAAQGNLALALDSARSCLILTRRAGSLAEVAVAYAQAGWIDRAMEIAKEIRTDWARGLALARTATTQANSGRFGAAFETAGSIEDDFYRAMALGEIAAVQAKASQGAAVRVTLVTLIGVSQAIEDKQACENSVAAIARAQARVGQFSAAIETARKIKNDRYRVRILAEVASAQAKAGHVQVARSVLMDALDIANKIEPDVYRATAIACIARAQAAGNQEEAPATFATALELAYGTDHTLVLAETLAYIAALQAEAGQFNSAYKTACSIEDIVHRSEALIEVVIARAKVGEFSAAIEITQGIQGQWARVRALAEIAAAQAEAGQIQAARETLVGAFDLSRGIDVNSNWTGALAAIGMAQVKTGRPQEGRRTFAVAVRTARSFESSGWEGLKDQSRVLREIAAAQARAGFVEGALWTTELIRTDRHRASRDGTRPPCFEQEGLVSHFYLNFVEIQFFLFGSRRLNPPKKWMQLWNGASCVSLRCQVNLGRVLKCHTCLWGSLQRPSFSTTGKAVGTAKEAERLSDELGGAKERQGNPCQRRSVLVFILKNRKGGDSYGRRLRSRSCGSSGAQHLRGTLSGCRPSGRLHRGEGTPLMTRVDIYGDDELNLTDWEQACAEGRPRRRLPRRRRAGGWTPRPPTLGLGSLAVGLLVTVSLITLLGAALGGRPGAQQPRQGSAARARRVPVRTASTPHRGPRPAPRTDGPTQTAGPAAANGGRARVQVPAFSGFQSSVEAESYLPPGWSRGNLEIDTPLYARHGETWRSLKPAPAGTLILVHEMERLGDNWHMVVGQNEEISGYARLVPRKGPETGLFPLPSGWRSARFKDGKSGVIRVIDEQWVFMISLDGELWGYMRREDLADDGRTGDST